MRATQKEENVTILKAGGGAKGAIWGAEVLEASTAGTWYHTRGGVGAPQGPNRIYSYKKGPPNGSCGFWWKSLLTTAKLRLGSEEQGGRHLLSPLVLEPLPAPQGSPAVAASWGTEKRGPRFGSRPGGANREDQHSPSENISSSKKEGDAYLSC